MRRRGRRVASRRHRALKRKRSAKGAGRWKRVGKILLWFPTNGGPSRRTSVKNSQRERVAGPFDWFRGRFGGAAQWLPAASALHYSDNGRARDRQRRSELNGHGKVRGRECTGGARGHAARKKSVSLSCKTTTSHSTLEKFSIAVAVKGSAQTKSVKNTTKWWSRDDLMHFLFFFLLSLSLFC